ncbi:MAG: biotin/lipoyl-binding protein [Acetobacteraceae bacterium]|nr:biotin/lipoyl-binding protein [Acetobacteraceae bacterium]
MFRSLLIANRGEIARRVIRTARRLGLRTVAVFSDADASAPFVAEADEAHRLGPAPAAESYLRGDLILDIARQAGAEAIHPGYGFLSENAEFAEACAAAGIAFVGPPPAAIRAMGSKAESKRLMVAAGVPTVPGYHGEDQSDALLATEAARIGFPVLIKASAGGGGKGMRPVFDAAGFAAELAGARREAQAAFGDDRVLLEKYLQRPRHVEVQVFGDAHGRVTHLHTRDCSVQRRHQKVLEEAPAPALPDALRARLHRAAEDAARAVGYVNAGTVEFIVEGEEAYFLEMNTRLQVEHPVTELVAGLDLVEWQLRVAAGEALPAHWPPEPQGHAVEVRLYAEDAEHDFRPATGRLTRLRWPGEGRVDAGIEEGDAITPFYDPMIAKVIAWGEDRRAALRRLSAMLAATEAEGSVTNLGFLRRLVAHPALAALELDTGFIARHAAGLTGPAAPSAPEAVLAAALAMLLAGEDAASPWDRRDGFRLQGAAEAVMLLAEGPHRHRLTLRRRGAAVEAAFDGGEALAFGFVATADQVTLRGADGAWRRIALREATRERAVLASGTVFSRLDPLMPLAGEAAAEGRLASPIPGRVVQLLVAVGDSVAAGQTLVVVEAMKTEIKLTAPRDAVVAAVMCAPGDSVAEGVDLLRLETRAAG